MMHFQKKYIRIRIVLLIRVGIIHTLFEIDFKALSVSRSSALNRIYGFLNSENIDDVVYNYTGKLTRRHVKSVTEERKKMARRQDRCWMEKRKAKRLVASWNYAMRWVLIKTYTPWLSEVERDRLKRIQRA